MWVVIPIMIEGLHGTHFLLPCSFSHSLTPHLLLSAPLFACQQKKTSNLHTNVHHHSSINQQAYFFSTAHPLDGYSGYCHMMHTENEDPREGERMDGIERNGRVEEQARKDSGKDERTVIVAKDETVVRRTREGMLGRGEENNHRLSLI